MHVEFERDEELPSSPDCMKLADKRSSLYEAQIASLAHGFFNQYLDL